MMKEGSTGRPSQPTAAQASHLRDAAGTAAGDVPRGPLGLATGDAAESDGVDADLKPVIRPTKACFTVAPSAPLERLPPIVYEMDDLYIPEDDLVGDTEWLHVSPTAPAPAGCHPFAVNASPPIPRMDAPPLLPSTPLADSMTGVAPTSSAEIASGNLPPLLPAAAPPPSGMISLATGPQHQPLAALGGGLPPLHGQACSLTDLQHQLLQQQQPTVVPGLIRDVQNLRQEDRAAKAGARALTKMVSQHAQVGGCHS